MAVKYNLVERGNPQKPTEPKKFYAQAIADGEVTQRDLCSQIEELTALTEPDVLAAISALRKVMVRGLSNGMIVRFGDFGSFQVTLSSDGAESADKFKPDTIRDVKITFRAGADLRDMLSKLKFDKA
jgi:predicted histone-like DNA-binding protein